MWSAEICCFFYFSRVMVPILHEATGLLENKTFYSFSSPDNYHKSLVEMLLPCCCTTPSQPLLFIFALSPTIHFTFPSPFVSVAFGSVLSSLQGPSDNREEAKRPARRTRLGKGDSFITVLDHNCSKQGF